MRTRPGNLGDSLHARGEVRAVTRIDWHGIAGDGALKVNTGQPSAIYQDRLAVRTKLGVFLTFGACC